MSDPVTALRGRGARLLIGCSGIFALLLVVGMALTGTPGMPAVLAVAVAVHALPTLQVLRRDFGLATMLAIGTLAAVDPALLVFAYRGHPWQMDMHMYFFVALAALIALCDWRAIVFAAGLVAVHHLLLDWVVPGWIFDADGDMRRVLVHALAVALQCAILACVTHRLTRLMAGLATARADAETTTARAQAAQAGAERALVAQQAAERRAADEEQRRRSAERDAAAARARELVALAGSFEQSVLGIVHSVGRSAERLDGSAAALNGLARDSGERSRSLALAADEASQAASSVAGGVGELSSSIASIAASVEAQAGISEAADRDCGTGDDAVRALLGRTDDIAGFTGHIRSIASRTNLLAINAAIEAAHGGTARGGFAVVASEVKTLARQTAAATSEIGLLIDSVHLSARSAEGSFRDITNAVRSLARQVTAIRATIGEQRATAARIERSASASATGATVMAERVEQVAEVASEAGCLSDEVRAAAGELLNHAISLETATRSFVGGLRAA